MGKGQFVFFSRRESLSITKADVSLLVPTGECNPTGAGGCGSDFFATVRIPSGARISLLDLFRGPDPKRGVKALNVAAERLMFKAKTCGGQLYRAGFAAKWRRLEGFALTTRGIIAAPIVGGSACPVPTATVPYSLLTPDLSRLGRQLAAAEGS